MRFSQYHFVDEIKQNLEKGDKGRYSDYRKYGQQQIKQGSKKKYFGIRAEVG